MKLLLDQGLPRRAAELLTKAGIETVHVGNIGYAEAKDDEILKFSGDEGYVIVTLDADFHALLALTGATNPSVIRVRIEGLKAEPAAKLIKSVFALCSGDLEQGAAVTVQEGRIRVRRFPLIPTKTL